MVIHDSNVNHFEQSYLPYTYRQSTITSTATATTNTATSVLGEEKGHNYDFSDSSARKNRRERSDIMYQTYNNDLNVYTTSASNEGQNNEGQNYDHYSQRIRLKARLSYIKSGHNSDLYAAIEFVSTSSCVGFTYTNITMTSTV